MKEGGPIKSARELIERAQIQLVLHDRLIWENGYSEGRFHGMEERKRQQSLEAEWIVSRGLDTVMSRGDTRLLNQEIETVEDPIRSQRSFECEAHSDRKIHAVRLSRALSRTIERRTFPSWKIAEGRRDRQPA